MRWNINLIDVKCNSTYASCSSCMTNRFFFNNESTISVMVVGTHFMMILSMKIATNGSGVDWSSYYIESFKKKTRHTSIEFIKFFKYLKQFAFLILFKLMILSDCILREGAVFNTISYCIKKYLYSRIGFSHTSDQFFTIKNFFRKWYMRHFSLKTWNQIEIGAVNFLFSQNIKGTVKRYGRWVIYYVRSVQSRNDFSFFTACLVVKLSTSHLYVDCCTILLTI